MIQWRTQSGNLKSDDHEMSAKTPQMKPESHSELSSDFCGRKSMNHMKIPSERLPKEAGVGETSKW